MTDNELADEVIDEENYEFEVEFADDETEIFYEVTNLLISWKLNHLIPILQQAEIDIHCLENMKSGHIAQLNLKLKDQIYLEAALDQWRSERVNPRARNSISNKEQPSQAVLRNKVHDDDINLDNVLQTEKGNDFLEYQTQHGFTETARTYLVEAICEAFLVKKLHMKGPDYKRITEQIVARFPEEDEIYYYVPQSNDSEGKTTAPGGKLYYKFNNSKRRLTKHGLYPVVYRNAKKNKSSEEPSFVEPDQTFMQEMEKLREWLRLNYPAWEVLEQKWKESVKYRKADLNKSESVAQILVNWPKYKTAYGAYLIDIDFQHLFPKTDSQSLLAGWETFASSCVSYCKLRLKNPESLELAKQIEICANEDARDLIMIYLLHAVLKPTVNIDYILNGTKCVHRPGIVESRTSMVLYVKNAADVEKELRDFHEKYSKLGLKVQPFVVAIGPEVTNVTEFITVIDDLRFKFKNLRHAIDVCLKAVYVFSLEYQKESQKIWKLLQHKFFFPLPRKKENADIILFSKEFNSL